METLNKDSIINLLRYDNGVAELQKKMSLSDLLRLNIIDQERYDEYCTRPYLATCTTMACCEETVGYVMLSDNVPEAHRPAAIARALTAFNFTYTGRPGPDAVLDAVCNNMAVKLLEDEHFNGYDGAHEHAVAAYHEFLLWHGDATNEDGDLIAAYIQLVK